LFIGSTINSSLPFIILNYRFLLRAQAPAFSYTIAGTIGRVCKYLPLILGRKMLQLEETALIFNSEKGILFVFKFIKIVVASSLYI